MENERTASVDWPSRVTMYRSAATAIALAWTIRLLGLLSVLILARLLSPRDFGIMAIASAVVALVEIFSALGLRQALLRIAEPERSHLDTAWTIQLLLMVVLGLSVATLGPPVAAFFQQPELRSVLFALSFTFLFYGCINIGTVEFDRKMRFGRDLKMRLTVRVTAIAGTVVAAVVLQSYWALVIGLLLQSGLHAVASYFFHPFRPRFSLVKRTELLGSSLWMFLAYAAQVAQHQAERLIVGRLIPLPLVGLYSVSKDLSSIFTLEIATALNRVTFVATARQQSSLSEDPSRAVTMLGGYAVVAAPMGLGLAAVADDAVLVLFGSQWRDGAPLLQLIAPAAACFAVYKLIVSSLQASGRARTAAALAGCTTAATIASLLAAGIASQDALVIARTALVSCAVCLSGSILLFARISKASCPRLLGSVLRPFIASAIMLLVVRLGAPQTGLTILDLGLAVGLGTVTYAILLFGLWRATGRANGFEEEMLWLVREAIKGRKIRSSRSDSNLQRSSADAGPA
jgi:lipopolysaccharide exporter